MTVAHRIAAYLAEHPDASTREVAAACGCSQRTAARLADGVRANRARKTVKRYPSLAVRALVRVLADATHDALTNDEVAATVADACGHRPSQQTISRYRTILTADDPADVDLTRAQSKATAICAVLASDPVDVPGALARARAAALVEARTAARKPLARAALRPTTYTLPLAGAALRAGPGRPRTTAEELGALRRRDAMRTACLDVAQRERDRAERAAAQLRDLEQLAAAAVSDDPAALRRTRVWRQLRTLQLVVYRLLTPDDVSQLVVDGILESEDATWDLGEEDVEIVRQTYGEVSDAVWAHYDNRFHAEGMWDAARDDALARGYDDDAASEAAEDACVDWTERQMVGEGRLPIGATAIRSQAQ